MSANQQEIAMAIYYAFGDALVDPDEIAEKSARGNFQQFQKELLGRVKGAKLEFSTGIATTESVIRSVSAKPGEAPIAFQPIGIGKPLAVQIRHVYTGDRAEGFWGSKDMLVASAMKSIAAYDAAPRALNFLVPKTKNNRNFRNVDATDKGTPLICYSPSLSQSSSVVTVEVMFSSFPKETFDAVSQAFSQAAGVPVFAPVSGYLVAAGIVTKLLANIGKSLTDGAPALKRTEEITFVTPGSLEAVAHFALLISDQIPSSVLKKYKVSAGGSLARVDKEDQLYDGPFPYVVISMDGRENADYKNFAPTAATAAELDKFYNINDGSSQLLTTLVDALKLYSDMRFREKAVDAAERLKRLEKDSEEYKKLLAQYDAYLNNIGTAQLKPSVTP
jgi:hypothetical protein